MKIRIPCGVGGRGGRAFTMIEIALALGVVAFAMVALIGVLPTGLTVQKDNLEDTIVNEDGTLLLEAIRSGSRGADELTNFFDSITVSNRQDGSIVFTNDSKAARFLTNGAAIVGLLSSPKYFVGTDKALVQNQVTAKMRAMSGSTLSRDPALKDFAFSYQATVEVVPFQLLPPEATNDRQEGLSKIDQEARAANRRLNEQMSVNSWEVRLHIQWPLYLDKGQWRVGGNRKVFRTFVAGQMVRQNGLSYIIPNTFTRVNTGGQNGQ